MNKSEIFQRAWYLHKDGNCSTFSECLKKAWKEAKTPAKSYALGLPESEFDRMRRTLKELNLLKKSA